MKNKIVHDALVLTAITLISGFLLGLVFAITKEPIKAAEEAKKRAAFKEVFQDAETFEAFGDYNADTATKAAADAGFENDTIDDVQTALDGSGNPLGYVITVTSKEGSQANITLSVGITSEGVVNGYSTTAISETPGLGMKVNDDSFKSQFEGKSEETYSVTKSPATSDSEIESISGATISSRAVTNAVNAALAYFRSIGG